MVSATAWLVWLGSAYVVGATPFGLLIGRMRGVDVRKVGSGNVGATNVGRALGKAWGVVCFVLDVGKGLGPTIAFGAWAGLLHDEALSAAAAGQWIAVGAAAVIGHVFSFWLKFRGGKGVATGLGALLGVWPALTLAALACGVIWLAIVKASGYVSLASVVGAAALPAAAAICGWLTGLNGGAIAVFAGVTAALGLLVIVRHRANLARLRAGTENKAHWARSR